MNDINSTNAPDSVFEIVSTREYTSKKSND